jgi:hypothetical protein
MIPSSAVGGADKYTDFKATVSQVEMKLPRAKSGIMRWITEKLRVRSP